MDQDLAEAPGGKGWGPGEVSKVDLIFVEMFYNTFFDNEMIVKQRCYGYGLTWGFYWCLVLSREMTFD